MSYIQDRLRYWRARQAVASRGYSNHSLRVRLRRWKEIIGDLDGSLLDCRLKFFDLPVSPSGIEHLLSGENDNIDPEIGWSVGGGKQGALSPPPNIESTTAGVWLWGVVSNEILSFAKQTSEFSTLIDNRALPAIATALFKQLHRLAKPVIEHELKVWQKVHPAHNRAVFNRLFIEEGCPLLTDFYPALADLIGKSLQSWRIRWSSLLHRLAKDRAAISTQLLGMTELGQVISVSDHASDMHDGHCVVVLILSSGRSVVYKPKDLSTDAFFNSVVSFHNRTCEAPVLRASAFLKREKYGWVEFIEHSAPANRTQVRNFWQSSGALLFYLYAFDATDAHQFNVICSNNTLCWVDTESLFHQREFLFRASNIRLDDLSESVLRTGLLPLVKVDKFGAGRVWGGLTPVVGGQNLPGSDGGSHLTANLACFEDGFRAAYRNAMAHRQALLNLVTQNRIRSRFILRSTQYYVESFQRTLAPQAVRSRIDRSLELEFLARLYLHPRNRVPPALLEFELSALERGDVPVFYTYSHSKNLFDGNSRILRRCFHNTSRSVVKQRIRELSSKDMEFQLEISRSALGLRSVTFDSRGKPRVVREGNRSSDYVPPQVGAAVTVEQAIEIATAIGDYLLARAARQKDDLSWIVPRFDPVAQVFALKGLDAGLYQGRSGIALFFAALSKITGVMRYRRASIAILMPLLRNLRTSDPWRRQGGMSGAASAAYSLWQIAKLLEDDDLFQNAQASWRFVDARLAVTEENVDVMSGAAGVALAAYGSRPAIPDGLYYDALKRCGNALLRSTASHPYACRTIGDRTLTGFSHGASGIALALLSIYSQTRQRSMYERAVSALEFEEYSFSSGVGNWPDLRYEPAGEVFQTAWCHGACGIGLARIAMRELISQSRLNSDLRRATNAIPLCSLPNLDSLCCGTAAQLALLIEASSYFDDMALWDTASRLAARMIKRDSVRGGFGFAAKPDQVLTCPGLFTGLAGIGYVLLYFSSSQRDVLPRPWVLR